MSIGFIKPTYPNEKRVALLPSDCQYLKNKPTIECGYGSHLNIQDEEYLNEGCKIKTRTEIFAEHDVIFCLKLIQPEDYDKLRENQTIIGWTHPTGSGAHFFNTVCQEKKIAIVDLDNISPTIYKGSAKKLIPWIPKNFISRNSWIAGFAAVQHALISHGIIPDSNTKIAVLSAGNVAQGALSALATYNSDLRLFTRSNMDEFKQNLEKFDIIVSGIEVSAPKNYIIDQNELSRIKINSLIIDAAADAGNSIFGTRFTTIDEPIYREDGKFFYVVNNAPSLYYRKASAFISSSFSHHVYNVEAARYLELL
jgi:N5-(carboxyethyl)ornithine synthase